LRFNHKCRAAQGWNPHAAPNRNRRQETIMATFHLKAESVRANLSRAADLFARYYIEMPARLGWRAARVIHRAIWG